MKVIIEDIEEELKSMGAEGDCGGGYCIGDEIHIDSSLSWERLRLTTIHEVLCKYLRGRIKHSKIDRIAIDLIDVLTQIETYKHIPDNKSIKWK